MGTRTLWIPADRQFPQLFELAKQYGVPEEAILLNADPGNPTLGLDLDDPEEVAALCERIRATNPGLAFIDTSE